MPQPFIQKNLKGLWRPGEGSYGEDNGQVTIIGGSALFHGAPLMAVKAASRLVDMVFLATPEPSVGRVAERVKSQLNSFIWVPWEEAEAYAAKSEAVLIGPGLMRYESERRKEAEIKNGNGAGGFTKKLTKKFLENFPDKKWVIDGGSLQVMEPEWIPQRAVVTPNIHEFALLFGEDSSQEAVERMARKYRCVVVHKALVSYVSDGETTYEIKGGNAGLTKGGTGDVLAGIIVGLLAKNPPLLAAAAGIYLIKKTSERLFERVGFGYNADDLAEAVFETKKSFLGY